MEAGLFREDNISRVADSRPSKTHEHFFLVQLGNYTLRILAMLEANYYTTYLNSEDQFSE